MHLRLFSFWSFFQSLCKPWMTRLLTLVVLGLSSTAHAGLFDQEGGQDSFLSPEQAFQVEAQVNAAGQVSVVWTAAPSIYLYKDQFAVSAQPSSVVVGPLVLPDGHRHYDEALGKEVESLRGEVRTTLALPNTLPASRPAHIKVSYQGCADAGLCYPPQTRFFQLTVNALGKVTGVAPSDAPDSISTTGVTTATATAAININTNTNTNTSTSTNDNPVTRALSSGNLLQVALVCLLAGLLLSLTPCVLPMLPILSSIILGQKHSVSRSRGFLLALAYSQGMALVYTLLGVAAGLLGQGLTAYLQHPWVLLGFAVLMVLLALSMFGLYELQLPASVQTWLSQRAQGLPGGQFVSVFLMGAVSALVVSPCITAPLAGALLYIGQTGNVGLGATALYAMALGMSAPLLLVGLSMGSLLPKAGPWMSAVKALFGVLILAMAVWMVRPAWPFLKAHVTGEAVAASNHVSVLPFQRITNSNQLDAALAQAAQEQRIVVLDFYADWCVACIEMEKTTFKDAAVQQRLQAAVLLQVDMTAHTADDRDLLKRFHLFGPPAILFFTPQQPVAGDATARVIGYQSAERFSKSLDAAGL